MKIPVTQLGIDPATLRFVAQCLNHCATACPVFEKYSVIYTESLPPPHTPPQEFSSVGYTNGNVMCILLVVWCPVSLLSFKFRFFSGAIPLFYTIK
jgi:hypothetical protein